MIVTISMLKEKYRDYANPLDKIKREADKGALLRLRKGLYETDPRAEPCMLASSILSPSYLSFEWALSHYGIIPERVVAITSASFENHKNKTYNNPFGRYEFSDIPSKAFPHGIRYLEEGEYIAKIATKEKAICDSLCKWRVVRNIGELQELLFEDKRLDEEEFSSCDFDQLKSLARLYQKTNLNLLIQFIEKGVRT